jgi:CPA1 family monovalent cation:H+ antiporter
MHSSSIQAVELIFLLLLFFVIAFGALARKLKVPYPIVMVIGGGLLALIPGIPRVELNPDLIFFVILPPLLYAAAWVTSWREFSRNIVNILLLAVGLVFFTVVGVAIGAPYFLNGFDWKLGLVLGAIVAPTDALAATTIAERIGLPKRISDVLEGESLVNDATGLLALEFGLALVARGQTLTVKEGVIRLLYLIVIGIGAGLLTGLLVDWIERRIDDGPIEIAISILTPYAAYLSAETAHASGVLAVVTCGLLLSRRSSDFFSPGVRLQSWSVWEALDFILNGIVFVLIGLQLRTVLTEINGFHAKSLLLSGALFSAFLIALRMLWVYPGAHAAYRIRCRLDQPMAKPTKASIAVVGWTGMRGVIALAAAMALPRTMADGSPFPHRNVIIFLAYSVILVTLVLQGLTLPRFVRWLGLAESPGRNQEEEEARREMIQAALTYLKNSRVQDEDQYAELYEDITGHYQQRLSAIDDEPDADGKYTNGTNRRLNELSRDLLRIERQTAVRLRNQGRINDETLRDLEYELDLREAGHPHAI